jgi:flagellar biosynthesis/type III secretory pathway protein FliH
MNFSKTIKLPAQPKKIRARWLPSVHELDPREQGYARGYNEGWKKAQEDCRREMEQRIQSSRAHWDATLKAIDGLPKQLAQKLQEQLITLAFQSVQKILAATPVTREEVSAQVQQILEHAESGSTVTIQLHPDDLNLLTVEDKGALWSEELAHLKWEPNPSIPKGGIMLSGEFGWLDGRRQSRLKKLEQRAVESVQKPTW